MKILIPVDECSFEKTNLVTVTTKTGSYDTYRCKDCGKTGRRFGLSNKITVTSTCKKAGPQKPKAVRITSLFNGMGFGLNPDDLCLVVPCPSNYPQFKNDLWVWSDLRGEPIRLLSHEYEAHDEKTAIIAKYNIHPIEGGKPFDSTFMAFNDAHAERVVRGTYKRLSKDHKLQPVAAYFIMKNADINSNDWVEIDCTK